MNTPYQEALGSTLISRGIRERIVLVAVTMPDRTDDETQESLDELAQLIDTAGADEVARITQRRDAPDSAYYIGKGKAEELKELCLALDSDTVVFDNELSPGQQFNLEKLLGRTALDRTAVILDIFAQNAHTLEGKAQVELALLRYRLPRIRRGAKAGLSQQAGGIGTRGPGETTLALFLVSESVVLIANSTTCKKLAKNSARVVNEAVLVRWRSSVTRMPASLLCLTV